MNSQQNPSLYEVWRPKIVDDIEKQTVRKMRWDGKVPGIYTGTKAVAAPGPGPAAGAELEHQFPPLPEQGGQPSTRRDLDAGSHCRGWGRGEIDTKWVTDRGGTHPMGLWTPAPERLGCQVTPGKGRS